MKKLFLILMSMGFAILGTACAMKTKVMDASLVSMTQTHVPDGMKLQEAGPVNGQFCPTSNDAGNVGLFDQAIKDTQDKHKIDFISSASFWRDEHGCILLEGTGQRLTR